jgi:cysteine synthase A
MDGQIDFFVTGVGTGGTFTGVSSKLKELKPTIKCVAVEPSLSPVISKNIAGTHKIQGIGAGFIPSIFDKSLLDDIITIKDEEAFETARELVKKEGILCGISSGANLKAAIKLASLEENKGKNIVTIVADTGERYLSTHLFNLND